MKKGKLLAATLFVGALILTPHAAQANEAYMPYGAPITIHIDGEYLPCDVAPMVKNNRTLMPMRAAGEALGATVDWDPTQKAITLSKDSDVVKFVLNSNTYYVNGTAHHADIAPQIVQNRTLIPLRAFAEALNTRVDWNQYLLDVSISTTGEEPPLLQAPSNVPSAAARWVAKYYVEPDSSDPFVGSWTRTSTNHFSPYESSTTIEYDFISKLNGNYQYMSVNVSIETQCMIKVYIAINVGWLLAWHYFVWREIRLSLFHAIKDVFSFGLIAAIIMAGVYFLTRSLTNLYLLITAKILLAGILYPLVMWLSGSATFKEALNYIFKKKLS